LFTRGQGRFCLQLRMCLHEFFHAYRVAAQDDEFAIVQRFLHRLNHLLRFTSRAYIINLIDADNVGGFHFIQKCLKLQTVAELFAIINFGPFEIVRPIFLFETLNVFDCANDPAFIDTGKKLDTVLGGNFRKGCININDVRHVYPHKQI